MDRRAFIVSVASGVLVVPRGAFAQAQGKVWRIGFFYFGSRQSAVDTGRYEAFVQGMHELGYLEGKNFTIEPRFADGKIERLPDLAADLVRLKVDVIVGTGIQASVALQHATTSIPVVVTIAVDPVIEGFAASLARPGGNFTGLTTSASYLGPKQLELLIAVVPQMSRVGALVNPDDATHPAQMKSLMFAAREIGVDIVPVEARTVMEIESGFDSLVQKRAKAVIVFGDSFFAEKVQQIAQVSLKRRVPSVAFIHEYVQVGGLMSYGADIVDNFRRTASYVDRILKGAKPGDLPIEQPERYTLAINLKTAKALGLSIPQSLLLRANEVIQ